MALHFISETSPAFDLTSLLTKGGIVGILSTIVIGFWKGWIVSGSTYKQQREACEAEAGRLRQERDRALDQVYKVNEIAHRALEAAERKVVP